MVDYPTAAPVMAFRTPVTPQQAARAAQATVRALDDIFNPAPRRPMIPQRRGRGLKPHPRAFGVGLIQEWLEPVDELVPAGIEQDTWLYHGWTLVADKCAEGSPCCGSCNGSNVTINRVVGYSIHAHTCCAATPQGTAFTPGANPHQTWVSPVAVDYGRRQGPFNWVGWTMWFERPLAAAGIPWLAPNIVDALRWRTAPAATTAKSRARARALQRQRLRGSRVTGTGRSRTTAREAFKPRRPPLAHEREAKRAPVGPGAGALVRLLDGILEGLDVVDAIHDALPPSCQSGATGATMIAAIKRCFPFIDWSTALENLIDNEIEDWFFGQFGNMSKKEAQALGRPRGLNLKPATKHGGWSPCLFCN